MTPIPKAHNTRAWSLPARIGISAFAAITAIASLTSPAAAQPAPGFWVVQSSSPGQDLATSVSADGNIVGGFRYMGPLNSMSFRWTRSGSTDIPALPSNIVSAQTNAISGAGQFITGQASSAGSFNPMRQLDGATLQVLPNLAGYSRGAGFGISDDGNIVVGASERGEFSNADEQPWRWTPQTGTVGLGFLPGFEGVGRALGVSADGSVIAGWTGFFAQRAFRWTESAGMQPLTWNNPNGLESTYALAVSSDGSTIVGSGLVGHFTQAVRWSGNDSGVTIGSLSGFLRSEALSVNADGSVIVGFCSTGPLNAEQAFYWTAETGMITLHALAALNGVTLPEGFVFQNARDISADGKTIVGTAYYPGSPVNSYFSYALTIPAPSTLAAAAFLIVRPRRRQRAEQSKHTRF